MARAGIAYPPSAQKQAQAPPTQSPAAGRWRRTPARVPDVGAARGRVAAGRGDVSEDFGAVGDVEGLSGDSKEGVLGREAAGGEEEKVTVCRGDHEQDELMQQEKERG
mmetsp:Transcript_25842/g.40075  ORF Transcript_25842/g.40075 Transcript_25842/m.40075 type:complete len:108 (-) Transcript_25842:76-399(-)